MTKWEYATVPLLVHATKQILDTWGEDGWELVQVVPGPGRRRAGRRLPEAGEVSTAEERLAELGLTLPADAAPLAAYVPAVRTGNLVFTSGPAAARRRRADRTPARSAPR